MVKVILDIGREAISHMEPTFLTFTTITTTIKTCFHEQDQHSIRQGQRAGTGRVRDN